MSTSFCCGLTCYGLVSYPGGVTNYRPLNKQETEINASPVRRLAGEGFSLASQETGTGFMFKCFTCGGLGFVKQSQPTGGSRLYNVLLLAKCPKLELLFNVFAPAFLVFLPNLYR